MNAVDVLTEIARLGNILRLPPHVIEFAVSLHERSTLKNVQLTGQNLSKAGGIQYVACRMFQIATTLEEVVSAEAGERSEFEEWVRFQLRKETGRNYRIIVSELQLQMPIDKPEKYIAKLATRLGISVTTQACALSLLDKADRLRFLSHPPPMALAASALYAACRLKGEKLTQQQIAQVAEIKEGTIRNWYLKLAPGEFE